MTFWGGQAWSFSSRGLNLSPVYEVPYPSRSERGLRWPSLGKIVLCGDPQEQKVKESHVHREPRPLGLVEAIVRRVCRRTCCCSLDPFDSSHVVYIKSKQSKESMACLVDFFLVNIDIFSWIIAYMLSINLEVMVLHLNINPLHPPVRQKKRSFILKCQWAIKQ